MTEEQLLEIKEQLLEIKEQLRREIILELSQVYVLKKKFTQSEDIKQKLSNLCKNKVGIMCLADGKIFESIKECAKFYKKTRQNIYNNIPKKYIRVGEIIPIEILKK